MKNWTAKILETNEKTLSTVELARITHRNRHTIEAFLKNLGLKAERRPMNCFPWEDNYWDMDDLKIILRKKLVG